MPNHDAFIQSISDQVDQNRIDNNPTNLYVAGMPKPIKGVTHLDMKGAMIIAITDDHGVFYVLPSAVVGIGVFEDV